MRLSAVFHSLQAVFREDIIDKPRRSSSAFTGNNGCIAWQGIAQNTHAIGCRSIRNGGKMIGMIMENLDGGVPV